MVKDAGVKYEDNSSQGFLFYFLTFCMYKMTALLEYLSPAILH